MFKTIKIAFGVALSPLLVLATAASPSTAPSDADAVGDYVTPEQIRKIDPPTPEGGGRRVIFICDAPASMKPNWAVVKDKLNYHVASLRPNQEFDILIFQENGCFALSARDTLPATPANKRKAAAFSGQIRVGGKTDPLAGLELAFKLKPQLLYLLTDHGFPDNAAVVRKIQELNLDKQVKVSVIAFIGVGETDAAYLDAVKKIADDTGGTFTQLNVEDFKDAPATQPAASPK